MEDNNSEKILTYTEIVKNYKNGNIGFKIELSLARKFLLDGTKDSNKFYLWSFINFFILPLVSCIIALFNYGILWGILYIVLYLLISLTINGMSSLNLRKTENYIFIFSCVILVIFLVKDIDTILPFAIAIIQFLSVYYFYINIGKTLINNYILKDELILNFLIENNIVFIQNIGVK